MHVIAAKAVSFLEAMQPEFVSYSRRVLENARVLGSELKQAGFRLVSGGTDNHLVLVDLAPQGVSGKQAEESLGRAGIVVNRNTVPFSVSQTARVAGGIRLGTPAVTSRGFGCAEILAVAGWISRVINNIDDPQVEKEVNGEVLEMCRRFPVPGIND